MKQIPVLTGISTMHQYIIHDLMMNGEFIQYDRFLSKLPQYGKMKDINGIVGRPTTVRIKQPYLQSDQVVNGKDINYSEFIIYKQYILTELIIAHMDFVKNITNCIKNDLISLISSQDLNQYFSTPISDGLLEYESFNYIDENRNNNPDYITLEGTVSLLQSSKVRLIYKNGIIDMVISFDRADIIQDWYIAVYIKYIMLNDIITYINKYFNSEVCKFGDITVFTSEPYIVYDVNNVQLINYINWCNKNKIQLGKWITKNDFQKKIKTIL